MSYLKNMPRQTMAKILTKVLLKRRITIGLYSKIILIFAIFIFSPSHAFAVPLGYTPKSINRSLSQGIKGLKGVDAEECLKALKKEPERPDLHACLASDAMKHKRWKEAVKHWDKAIRFSKDRENTGFYVGLAQVYLNLKDASMAVGTIQQAINIDPESITLHYWLASFYDVEKQPEKARKEYEKIVFLNPDEKIPIELFFHAHGIVAAKKDKGFGSAEKELQSFLKLVPDHYLGMTLLGYVNIKLRKPNRAIEVLEKGEAIKPAHLPIQLLLSQAHLMMGNADLAIKHGNRLLEDIPDHLTANYLVGTAYLKKGESEKGIEYLNKAAEGDIRLESAKLLLLGKTYLSEGKFEEAMDVLEDLASQDPEEISVRVSLIRLLIQGGKSEEAIKQCDKVLKTDSKNYIIRYLKTSALLASKKVEEAERLLETIIRDEGEFYPARIQLIRLYAVQGKFDLALQTIDNLIQKRPDDIAGYLIKGDLFYVRGEQTKALNAYKKAVEIRPESTLAWTKILQVRIEKKELSEAEQIADRLIQKHPSLSEAYLAKGIVYLLKEKSEEAKVIFQKVLNLNENHFKAHNYLGFIKSNGMEEEAIRHYEASLMIDPLQPAIYVQVARLYVKLHDKEKGLETAKRWANLYPDQGEPYELMAIIYAGDDEIREAVQHVEIAIALEPKNSGFYLSLGALYERQGNKKNAIAIYEEALKNVPDHPILLNNLAWFYAETDRLKDALVLAKKAEQKVPEGWGIKDTIGWIYYRKGDYKEAIKKYKEALSINDKNPILQYHIGKAYLAVGEKQKALKHLTKAENSPTPFPEEVEIRELIESLKNQ